MRILSQSSLISPACSLCSAYKSLLNWLIRPSSRFFTSSLVSCEYVSIFFLNSAFWFYMNLALDSLFALSFLIFSLSLMIYSPFSEQSCFRLRISSLSSFICCLKVLSAILSLSVCLCSNCILRQSVLLSCSSLRYFKSSLNISISFLISASLFLALLKAALNFPSRSAIISQLQEYLFLRMSNCSRQFSIVAVNGK